MKKLILSALLLTNTYAYQCDHFTNDANKMETLDFVSTQVLGYESVEEFCKGEDYLDLELNFMPNYFRYLEEEDDHYKFMIHKSYSSCTFIYNITQKFISEKSCYSTW
jgi:hypothetical protein